MEKTSTVTMLTYQEQNYSNLLNTSTFDPNTSTLLSASSPSLEDIQYNEFVRRWFEFFVMIVLFLIGTFGNIHIIL